MSYTGSADSMPRYERAHRSNNAQRGLKIRGWNGRRKWLGERRAFILKTNNDKSGGTEPEGILQQE